MADVEHSQLTGSDLHEPKGAFSAAANRVYVSDGVGSGVWSQVDLDLLEDSAKAFQAQLMLVKETKSGSAGTITENIWTTRDLNTVEINEITGASLASNRITLPTGTYYIEGRAPANKCAGHMCVWYNITDSTFLLLGSSAASDADVGPPTDSVLCGRFTIGSNKVFEMQHNCEVTRSTDGLGVASSRANETYATVKIWKIG